MPNGKLFEKGNKYGRGTPPLPPEIRQMALKTRKEALALLGEMLHRPWQEILEIFQDPNARGFDAVLAAMVVHTKKGSPRHLTEMWDRLYGKVTERVEHKIIEPFIIDYPDGSREVLGANIKDKEEE